MDDYMDVLESNLRALDSYKPEDESLDAKYIVDGQIFMARLFYESLYRSIAVLVELNGDPVINIEQELRDDFIYDDFYVNNARGQIVTKIVTVLTELLLKGINNSPILFATVSPRFGFNPCEGFLQIDRKRLC